MKKTVKLLILLMPLILFSCFEFVGAGTSKRMLDIFLAAPADVARIHVAVFDGALTPDRVIYKQSFAAGSSIQLDLPVGDNRFIVVWGEGFSGTGNYFGSIGPIPILENDNTLVPIRMNKFYIDPSTSGFNVSGGWSLITWNTIPGAITYSVEYTNGDVQITSSNSIIPTYGIFVIRVLTSVFDLSSDSSNELNIT